MHNIDKLNNEYDLTNILNLSNILKYSFFFILDIDQLTRILVLCGTPTEETLNKITSEEVSCFKLLCSNNIDVIYK